MKIQKFLSALNIFLGLLLAFVPFVLFPVCGMLKPDGSPMNCFYGGIFIMTMGILIFAFAILKLKKFFPSLLSILLSVCAVLPWLVPNEIIKIAGDTWACDLCAAPEHGCGPSNADIGRN